MSKKLLPLLLLLLGLVSWPGVVDDEDYAQTEDKQVRAMDIDGVPIPR